MHAYTLVRPTKRYPCDFTCLARSYASTHKRRKARRRGPHRARVGDGGLDLGAVTDDRGVLQRAVDASLRHRRDLRDGEAVEGSPERVPLAEHDRPAEPGLEHTQGEASNDADSSSVRIPQTSSWWRPKAVSQLLRRHSAALPS